MKAKIDARLSKAFGMSKAINSKSFIEMVREDDHKSVRKARLLVKLNLRNSYC